MLNRGDTVRILPQYQDPGDDEFTWVVVGDEEKGRVDVSPVSIPMKVKPVYTLEVEQVELVHPRT
jgi:hypothetical protein